MATTIQNLADTAIKLEDDYLKLKEETFFTICAREGINKTDVTVYCSTMEQSLIVRKALRASGYKTATISFFDIPRATQVTL